MRRGASRAPGRLIGTCLCAVLAGACGSTEAPGRPLGERQLPAVTLPDISRMDAPVQVQMREQFALLTRRIENPETNAGDLSAAYGRMGMLLQAAEYYDAAEPALLNARTLAPDDMRWPYYLAHLYKNVGRTDDAVTSFQRVLELRPNDVPALVELGRLYLDRGEPELAEPLFVRALSHPPRLVAVLAGLGQVALAKEDYARAVEYLEEALALNPKASSVHSPLAMAYRGLGQRDRAAAHLEQWSNTDILVPDPLRNELDLLLQSGLSYELRGIRAFEAGDWNAAAGFFRQGLALTSGDVPLSRSLRHKLGTALFLSGDAPGALTQFEEVVRLAPASGLDEAASKAYYSIGVLMASSGRTDEAIEHFSGAVRYQPNYPEAHLGLADVLRRAGRVRESLSHYERVLALNPQTAEAEFGYTMGLVRLQRHREARERLISAMRNHPDRPQFAQALARLLAASPDDEVRDGERAMMLVQQLLQQGRNLDLGETLAMTLAELGDFVSAEATLRDVIASAERVGMTDAVRRMAVNLDLYENRRPCRTPWQDDDPVHLPGPPVDPSLIAALTASPGG